MPNISIIGLGNPGQKYTETRHNIGKDWVISYCKEHNIDLKIKNKLDASVAISGDKKILWGHPNLYVNESGQSINKIIKNTNQELMNTVILHDDLDLPIGTLKLKIEGGHGGHNGLKSIIGSVGSGFLRIRIGIGHPGQKEDVTSWVLGKFKPQEKKLLADSYIAFLSVIEMLTEKQIERVQLQLHTG